MNNYMTNTIKVLISTLFTAIFLGISFLTYMFINWGSAVAWGWKLVLLPLWLPVILTAPLMTIYCFFRILLHLTKLYRNVG